MGCGVSRSNEGLVVFRIPHHSKPQTHPPKLLIEEPSNLHQPPELQKINIAYHDGNGNDDPLWVGSPSFREYVQSFPEDDDVATSGVNAHMHMHMYSIIIAHGYHATFM